MREIDEKSKQLFQKLVSNITKSQKIETEYYDRYNVKRGLRNEDGTGVLVGLTEVGEVSSYVIDDNERIPTEGRLFYRGIEITNLVNGFYQEKRFGFEESVYLVLFGELPNKEKLADFEELLSSYRQLPTNFVEDMIMKAPSPDIMNKLARTYLALYSYEKDPDNIDIDNVLGQCISLIAITPLLISYAYMAKRHYIDNESLFLHSPKPEYNTAQNILHLIRPDCKFTELEARILDLALTLHIEHGGGNNSSFVTHAVSSTGSDTYSVMSAAVGSLKGPRHGGASGRAYDMMQDLKSSVTNWRNEREVENYIVAILNKEAFDKAGLVYGIGHAVYTISDPRTKLLRDYARSLAFEVGREKEYELYNITERLAPEVFQRVRNSDKVLSANVDFYTGFIYDMLKIPKELFTPLFATARIAGWSAHMIEEILSGGRIMRPAYKSVMKRRAYTPMDKR